MKCITVPFIRSFEGLLTPKGLDFLMRHEFRHFIQDRVFNEANKGSKFNASIVEPSYYHGASQNEIDADRSARIDVIKTDLMGFIKSDTKIHAFKGLVSDVKSLAKTEKRHFKDKITYYTKGRFFASKEDKEIQQNLENENKPQSTISPTGPLFYSYGQLVKLVDKDPSKFTTLKSFYEEGGLAKLKEYRESNLPLHREVAFFGFMSKSGRDCGYIQRDENGNNPIETHEFDRYDKVGNLIDKEDLEMQYEGYTPQEVLGYEKLQTEIKEMEKAEESTENDSLKVSSGNLVTKEITNGQEFGDNN